MGAANSKVVNAEIRKITIEDTANTSDSQLGKNKENKKDGFIKKIASKSAILWEKGKEVLKNMNKKRSSSKKSNTQIIPFETLPLNIKNKHIENQRRSPNRFNEIIKESKTSHSHDIFSYLSLNWFTISVIYYLYAHFNSESYKKFFSYLLNKVSREENINAKLKAIFSEVDYLGTFSFAIGLFFFILLIVLQLVYLYYMFCRKNLAASFFDKVAYFIFSFFLCLFYLLILSLIPLFVIVIMFIFGTHIFSTVTISLMAVVSIIILFFSLRRDKLENNIKKLNATKNIKIFLMIFVFFLTLILITGITPIENRVSTAIKS